MGCSKNLVTGHCSTVSHFRWRRTPKAWRGCCHHRESGTQELCVHSLDQMEKGHSVAILKSQQFQGGMSTSGTVEASWAHSAALLCAGRGFWESDGLHSSWKLSHCAAALVPSIKVQSYRGVFIPSIPVIDHRQH